MNKVASILALTAAAFAVRADEGLWLFNQPPRQAIQKKYGFTLSDDFLKKLRLASVRFNSGGSGSFVSSGGMLFTNHHVGIDCIQKISTGQNDYVKSGFYAARLEDEKACPDLEVNVLLSIEDVTARVTAGIDGATPMADAGALRRAAQSRIEKECADKTGQRCDVVALYGGGQFHLYQYRKYTDIRLVFAPEYSVAFFGGDPDNFTYPRYNLDFALFRAYENDKPVKPIEYFRWSRAGAKEGELTFVAGHPGTTSRLATVAELEFSRDHAYPALLGRFEQDIAALQLYMKGSDEQRRAAVDSLASRQNAYKAYLGFEAGLKDGALMKRKRADEEKVRQAVADDPAKQEQYGRTWDNMAGAYAQYREIFLPYYLLEGGPSSELFTYARTLLRLAEEKPKPNEQRLREFAESRWPSLEQDLYSEAPVTASLEAVQLASYFRFAAEKLGVDHPAVQAAMGGRTADEAARAYVAGSKLQDVGERQRLARDAAGLAASGDTMIALARLLDGPAREIRKRFENQVEAVRVPNAARMAEIRYALYGDSEYPDATFTLRLSYGETKGYVDAKGERVPWATDFAGMYRRATGQPPYELPARWAKAPRGLNLKTPFNFVSTHDTHGGNSGSPTVNTRGELVGILFDGNLEGLPNRFVFREERGRSVHVTSQGILESLRKVYKADRVVKELTQ